MSVCKASDISWSRSIALSESPWVPSLLLDEWYEYIDCLRTRVMAGMYDFVLDYRYLRVSNIGKNT